MIKIPNVKLRKIEIDKSVFLSGNLNDGKEAIL